MADLVEVTIQARDSASAAFRSAGEASKSFGQELKSIGALAAGMAGGALFASFAQSAAGAFKSAVAGVVEFTSETSKMVRETGLSAEQASTLLAAFERMGV